MKRSKLLVSDVDFTLLGDDDSLTDFRDWFDARKTWLRLVLTSGRFVDSVVESVRHSRIPEPEIVIGGVGTQCRVYASGDPVPGWESRQFAGWSKNRVQTVLRQFDRLRPQPEEFQSEFKISYFLHDASSAELNSLKHCLNKESISVELVYSSGRDLDVLPAGCNKGTSAEFVANYLGFSPSDVIVSGDSANDLAMFDRGFAGIVVGNAAEELMAMKGNHIYKSSRLYASGVLEGMEYWLNNGATTAGRADGSVSAEPHSNESAVDE